MGVDRVPKPGHGGLAIGIDRRTSVFPGVARSCAAASPRSGAALVAYLQQEFCAGWQRAGGIDDQFVLEIVEKVGLLAVNTQLKDLQAGEIDVETLQILAGNGRNPRLAANLVAGRVNFKLKLIMPDIVAAIAQIGKEAVACAGGADEILRGRTAVWKGSYCRLGGRRGQLCGRATGAGAAGAQCGLRASRRAKRGL